jgi:flagellar basal body-associated protein FliL
MKKLMRIFIAVTAVMICLGFAGAFLGCEKEADSPSSEAEKIAPQVEETIPPPATPPVPAERQPLESQGAE